MTRKLNTHANAGKLYWRSWYRERHAYFPRKSQSTTAQSTALILEDSIILFGYFNCKKPNWRCPKANVNVNELVHIENQSD
ncbi:hypothetical protein EVAR_31492_1 [Eumeta japonica]|uniref:Uncharacterized protein n=1 Tax=Eumeta variegata TaxID=151549 RepID=A0A4C1WBU5_EUMVA|nr:hypothetical protein EVAR_31492_1 [Eumeta japonica]